MRGGRIGSFIRDESAGGTVEFVGVIGPFLLITFFIFEVMIAILWIGTAEKAAQLGARLAVVSNPAVLSTSSCPNATGLPASFTNCLETTNGHVYGEQCSAGACVPYCTDASSCTCTGATKMKAPCVSVNFDYIFDRMESIFNLIKDHKEYVTITYAYNSQLGFAGGPIIPSVTVKLSGIPYGAIVTTLLGNFFAAGKGTSPLPTNLPDISVTLTGEDLSTAGA